MEKHFLKLMKKVNAIELHLFLKLNMVYTAVVQQKASLLQTQLQALTPIMHLVIFLNRLILSRTVMQHTKNIIYAVTTVYICKGVLIKYKKNKVGQNVWKLELLWKVIRKILNFDSFCQLFINSISSVFYRYD